MSKKLNLKKFIERVSGILSLTESIDKTSGDVGIRCRRTDSVGDVGFEVGSGGANHGVYSFTLGKWLIYGNGTDVYVDGTKFKNVSETNATKVGSAWTSGTIKGWRRGNMVYVYGSTVAISALTARTTVASLPTDLQPLGTTFVFLTNCKDYILINPDGTIQFNAISAGNYWFSAYYMAKAS